MKRQGRNRGFSRTQRRALNGNPGQTSESRREYAGEALAEVCETMNAALGGDISIGGLVPHFRQLGRELREKAGIQIDQTLLEKFKAEREAFRELFRFRKEHGIERACEAPDDRAKVFSMISMLLGLEVAWAIPTLGQVMPNMLLAVIPAMFPAFVTICLALLASESLRRTNLRARRQRLAGWAGVTLSSFAATVGHFFTAHFRETFGTGDSFVAHAIASPLTLSSDSVWLFIFGVLCFGLTLYKLYRSDDPIPDLGRKSRALNEARAAFTEELAAAQNTIEVVISGNMDDAEAIVRRSRERLANVVRTSEFSLRCLGVLDPNLWAPGDQEDKDEIAGLITYRDEARALLAQLDGIGDIRLALSTREGEEPGGPPKVVKNLPDAVTVTEAMIWLDGLLERFGVKRSHEDGLIWVKEQDHEEDD